MCSICPNGMWQDKNECKSCGCKLKGSVMAETCNIETGECNCNNKAISGEQGKCEIYSCDNDNDCAAVGGVCWRLPWLSTNDQHKLTFGSVG